MKYRIENQYLFVDEPDYGAFGDDFSFKERESIDIIINEIELVLRGEYDQLKVGGMMCYSIIVSKNTCSINCYDEFLGEERTSEIYEMFRLYRKQFE